MKIRVFSDIHLDVNDRYPFSLKDKEKDEFTLIAGDVSGNVKLTAKWIKQNIKQGMFVCGNHDPTYNNIPWTINKQKKFLHAKFGLENDVTFLDESVGVMSKMIPNTNILVIGSTLYTDYLYMDEDGKKWLEMGNKGRAKMNEEPFTVEDMNMRNASRRLNDFRWGHVEDEFDDRGLSQRLLSPRDYKKWFDTTFTKMKDLIESNSDKDIIVLTHHCPSPMLISPEYLTDDMNASYVSNLEDFITSHKNIKAWCCGHVHHRNFLELGDNRQLIVCNPRGYERNFESDDWSPNLFIDTDNWKIVKEPYENKKLEAIRKKAHDDFMKYAPLFM